MLNSFLSQLLFGSNVEATTTVINAETTTTQNKAAFIDRNTDIDWVIVDPDVQNVEKNLQDLKRSLNLARSLNEYGLQDLFSSTMQCSKKCDTDGLNSDGGDDETISTSNDTTQSGDNVQHEQMIDQQEVVMIGPQPQPKDTWLITPLPSLVSLNTSQRSIVDCGALENLLIEHPSMSVFVSVGEDDIDEDDVLVADVYENADQIEMEQQEKKSQATSPKAPTPKKRRNRKQKNKQTSVIRTAVTNALQQQQQMQPIELQQQAQAQATIAKQKVLCNYVHNQQQIKRNNKLQNTVHFHNNVKQRKYHNLQQPKFVRVC